MRRTAVAPLIVAALSLIALQGALSSLSSLNADRPALIPEGGCYHSAAVAIVVGSGPKPKRGFKAIDHNLRSKWKSKGNGESLWLELAAPAVIDSVAIAFHKGHKRKYKFSVYLVTKESQAELVFEGVSSGKTKQMQMFSFGDKAQEALAVTITGYGNDKNKWNGYAEVDLCAVDAPSEATKVEVEAPETETGSAPWIENTGLPFPAGRKGFNVVNMCSFPIRVGSTGSQAPCSEGTKLNPSNGNCFWALPDGQRDLRPGETGHYVLPELGVKEGSLIWAGNIWASTGCTSAISGDYDNFPSTPTCVTNFCPRGGTCPDYMGPSGASTKAEFAMLEGGLDFYDVSIIDGSNIPMEIVPIDPLFHVNDHFCGTPGNTDNFGELAGCPWKFSPDLVDGFEGTDLARYTRLVWPADPDKLTSCLSDAECQDSAAEKEGFGFCGIYEERGRSGASFTGSAIPGVCGRPVGWIGGHTVCGSRPKGTEVFPGGFPYNCDLTARHGTIKQLIRCSGSVYGKRACYLPEAEDSCCGCPSWDIQNGGCVSTNPDWTRAALPWANFFKSACPTAYSFPRDDRTSMFVCSNEATDGIEQTGIRKNTQSYAIKFCPGDSEQHFYG